MTRAVVVLPIVVRDTREQEPLSPFVYRVNAGIAERLRFPTRDTGLDAGDYSLPGLEKMVTIERKSVADLWGTCLGQDPLSSNGEARSSVERFRREMARLSWLSRKAILVEGSKGTLLAYARQRFEDASRATAERGRRGPSRTPEENVNSILDILAAIWVDYGVPVEWAGGREGAEVWLGRTLWRIWDQHTGGAKARTVRGRGLGIEELPWLAEEAPRLAEAGGYPTTWSGQQRAKSAAKASR